jgi:hypothetical protein
MIVSGKLLFYNKLTIASQSLFDRLGELLMLRLS